jgi:hypothetical protein
MTVTPLKPETGGSYANKNVRARKKEATRYCTAAIALCIAILMY